MRRITGFLRAGKSRFVYWMKRLPGTHPIEYAPCVSLPDVQDVGLSGAEVFFGYHDRSPFSGDNRYVLAHVFRGKPHLLSPARIPVELGVFDLEKHPGEHGYYRTFGSSRTWSWQQASMMLWHPAHDGKSVLFNELGSEGAVTSLVVPETGEVLQKWPFTFYAMAPDGKRVLGLDSGSLAHHRNGYGFPVLLQGKEVERGHENPAALTLFDLTDSTGTAILEWDSLTSDSSLTDRGTGYLNHAGFSPDGRYASVFHIRELASGRTIDMWFVDLEAGLRSKLDTDRLVSHYCWLSPTSLLITNRDKELNWRYSVYDVVTRRWDDLDSKLDRDGHPMAHPGSGRIVTDAVPDVRRDQQVFISNLELGDLKQVASFHSPQRFKGPLRCDLHPRFSPDGSMICVDRVKDGRRVMTVMKVRQ